MKKHEIQSLSLSLFMKGMGSNKTVFFSYFFWHVVIGDYYCTYNTARTV